MTQITSAKPSLPEPGDSGRTPYGWRFERRTLPDGTKESVEVPLTVEDLLHPREGDCIPENSLHSRERGYLYDVLQSRFINRPAIRVFSDCIINWGVPGLGNHSPDISVFTNVRDRERRWGTFPVAKQKARPLLVVEIVSADDQDPRRRENDVVIKVGHYRRAGVPLYIIVDQEKEDGPRRLIGYRDTPEGYVPLAPDDSGRLLLEPVGILLGLRENRIVCFDAATGEEIPDYTHPSGAIEAEARARRLAEQQVEAAKEQVGAERASAQAARERAAAEQTRAEAALEQAAAERASAEVEAQIRAALEGRIRELEAQLQRTATPPEPGPGP